MIMDATNQGNADLERIVAYLDMDPCCLSWSTWHAIYGVQDTLGPIRMRLSH